MSAADGCIAEESPAAILDRYHSRQRVGHRIAGELVFDQQLVERGRPAAGSGWTRRPTPSCRRSVIEARTHSGCITSVG